MTAYPQSDGGASTTRPSSGQAPSEVGRIDLHDGEACSIALFTYQLEKWKEVSHFFLEIARGERTENTAARPEAIALNNVWGSRLKKGLFKTAMN
jgi:hypothetical protein